RDPFFQPDDLEAVFPLLLAGLRFLLRLVLARFHREPPFTRSAVGWLRSSPRRADRSPGRCRAGEGLARRRTSPAALLALNASSQAERPEALCFWRGSGYRHLPV